MTDRPMKYTAEIPTPATNAGYKLYIVEQVTDAAIADNDTITFPNTDITDIHIVAMYSATGQVINFDALADSSGDARFTIDHPDAASSKHTFGTLATGAGATHIKGLVLARHIGG